MHVFTIYCMKYQRVKLKLNEKEFTFNFPEGIF